MGGPEPRPTPPPTSLLFVYGTLRPGSGHARAAWLAARSASRGPATVAGRLLDLGAYPALVVEEGPALVHGELVEVAGEALPDVLAVLDRYEGAGEDPPLFRRVSLAVQGGRGETCRAWAWVWARPHHGLRVVESGAWPHAGSAT